MASTSPDYIIIGGGTSGLVVANRLSEDSGVEVLVLEAGDDLTADPRVNVPAFWTTLIGSDSTAWQVSTLFIVLQPVTVGAHRLCPFWSPCRMKLVS